MRLLFKKRIAPSAREIPAQEYPLTAICKIDSTGIHYIDSNSHQSIIEYRAAYKSWCKNRNIRKAKPQYICDRAKADGRKLLFHTNPRITFYARSDQEALWVETINSISTHNYYTFDLD